MRWTLGFTVLVLSLVVARADAYRVLAEDNWPPFSYEEAGELRGVSVDLVREALSLESTKLELVRVPYLRCLALTELGKEPACFNSAKNKELQEKYSFPNEYLFRSRGLIISNKQNKKARSVTAIKDLEGETVVLPSGFPFGKEFDDNHKILKQFTANDFTSLRLVASGRMSYAATDEMVLYYYLERNPQFKGKVTPVLELSNEPIYVHFSKKHPEAAFLQKKLEAGLRKLKASSEYERILRSWLGPDVPIDSFR